MKRTLTLATIFAAVWLVSAALAETGNELFQKALVKERSEGNLKEAIKLYQQVVDKYGKDRALAAKALVAIGESQEKLGQTEARKTYERIVREYGDQKEAATLARARLGVATASNPGGSTRQLWTKVGGAPYGPVSPDGRYLAFTAYEAGGPTGGIPNLAVHDFITGADLVLTHSRNQQDHPTRTGRAFSPDSKQIAFPWLIVENGQEHSEIRITEVSGKSPAKPRVLFRTENRLSADDWSPDGKWIALNILRNDGVRQLGLLSTADGSLRTLKSTDWTGTKVHFSPDSQFLAFDLPSAEGSKNRDIFVLAVDGSREVPAVTHPADDRVSGWTPDGKHLLFISDRNGLPGLWWLPFEDGKPQGDPEILRPNFGANVSAYLGPGRSGELYYQVLGGGVRVSVGSLDLASGRLTPGSTRQLTGNIYPAWSPDGKYLAFSTYELTRDKNIFLSLHSLETGQTRELHPQLNYAIWPAWSPDGRSLLVQAQDLKGRAGIFKVDVQNAEAAPVLTVAGGQNVLTPQWLPDGKKILYERNIQNESIILERDLASGAESEIVRVKTLRNQTSSTRSFLLSPDGLSLAYLTSDGISVHTAIMLKPLAGGESRELLKLNDGAYLEGWSPDGQSLLYGRGRRATAGENSSAGVAAWLLPIRGGEPRQLDLGESFVSQVQLHPDGKHIAIWSNNQTGEQVWVLENLLPSLTAKK